MPPNFTALLSTPSDAEKALAKESSRKLAPLIHTGLKIITLPNIDIHIVSYDG